jgi:hypothetical protein
MLIIQVDEDEEVEHFVEMVDYKGLMMILF